MKVHNKKAQTFPNIKCYAREREYKQITETRAVRLPIVKVSLSFPIHYWTILL